MEVMIIAMMLTDVDACMEPVDVGPCREAHGRYFYDADRGVCQEFVYGGCGGNLNRFDYLDECEQTCMQSSGNMLLKISTAMAVEDV